MFAVHYWLILPFFEVENTMPVLYQHLLLGGFSVIIFLVTQFGAKHYASLVGFGVLGFLLLKMIFLAAFINFYDKEIEQQPNLKFILLGFYFVYLFFLLFKIVPVINNISTEKKP